MQIQLRKIGTSVGLILPKKLLDKYDMHEGEEIYVEESKDGILLSHYDPEFARTMEIYKEGAKKYKNALRDLAHEKTDLDKRK